MLAGPTTVTTEVEAPAVMACTMCTSSFAHEIGRV